MQTRITYLFALMLLLFSSRAVHCQQRTDANLAKGEQLTLEHAIALALLENRQVKTAALEVDKASDRLAAARTQRLPQFKFTATSSQLLSTLDFKFDRGVFGDYPGLGPIPSTETIISTPRKLNTVLAGQVNQPLSQLYRIGLNLKQLGVGRELAKQEVRAQQQTIVNNVKQTYYAILQTQSALRTNEETLKLYRELDRVTGEYVVQQVALKGESLEVKTRLAKAEYDALELNDTLAAQKEQLNQLLGRDIHTAFTVSPAPALSHYEMDLDTAHQQALNQRPEMQEARLKIKQANYDRRIKKSEYLPELSMSFNYVSPQSANFAPRQITTAGLSLSWEPFDWGRKKRELAEKDRGIAQAELNLQSTESAVLSEVNSKFRKLQQTRQLLTIGQLTQDSAREQVRVAANRYNAQAALLKDVLQAQNTLADANHQYQQALLACWTARADFEKAIGGDQ